MKLTLSFPVLMTAKPSGARKERNIHLVSKREWDIPEYSSSEATLAYRDRERLTEVAPGYEERDTLWFKGKFFRPLGSPEDAVKGYYSHPFYSAISENFCDGGLNMMFEGRLRLRQKLGIGSKKTWPDPVHGEDSRNMTALEDVLPGFEDFDEDEYTEVKDSVARAVEGLVIFDNVLWCETAPPRRQVVVTEHYRKPYFAVSGIADFADSFPALHYSVSQRQFAIENAAEASEYAEFLTNLPETSRKQHDPIICCDVEALISEPPFDGLDEQVRRISRELAYLNVVAAYGKPELGDNLTESQLGLLETARASLLTENHLLGRAFDMRESCQDLLDIWRALGRPKSSAFHGMKEVDLVDRLMETVISDWTPVPSPVKASALEF